ncbi:Hypothetical protein, putative [Bodo saltans]|uniref:Uncharacterized protein n=1 Tax=Bodo saltans TaxID=75058 RepID=A0A0S4KIP9_BODSA|nr:Hypothetical protein, putative [Bodo saltans]|eukprot:CUI14849.1 Hypothetical protein, putative [Bodo saltans]
MSLVFCFATTTEEGRSFGIMSKPLARGGGGAAGGKWVSSRTQQAQTAPPAAPAHAAGSHGFEDSAIQERAHSRAVPEEQAAGVNFDRQTATDALSNLFLFREAEDEGGFPKLEVGKSIYPASTIDFKKDVLALVKASK